MMNRIKLWFDRMPMTRKATILHEFLVVFTVIVISAVILYSSRSMRAGG